MRIKFFVSSGESFVCDAPNGADKACLALPKDADQWLYWRKVTGDQRIRGHALVWEVVPYKYDTYEDEPTLDEESAARIG